MLTSWFMLPIQDRSAATIEGGAAADRPEGTAVARRRIGQPVGEPQAAGALHVLGQQGRIAGNEPAHVAGEHAGIDVVAAAGRVADIDLDGLAPVEIGDAVGPAGDDRPEPEHQGADRPNRKADHKRAPRGGFLLPRR
jgi:hypothetical protein